MVDIQCSLVLLGKLQVDHITQIPQRALALTISQPQSYPRFRNKIQFTGCWRIAHMQHVGNFRQHRGRAWMTTIDCVPATTQEISQAGIVPAQVSQAPHPTRRSSWNSCPRNEGGFLLSRSYHYVPFETSLLLRFGPTDSWKVAMKPGSGLTA